jgi:peptide/nickel transport system permease protein
MATATATVRPIAEPRASRGLWSDAARRLLRNAPAVLGLLIIAAFISIAIVAPLIAPYGPLEGTLTNRLQPPSPAHPMGTDLQGRDEFSRVLYGAQVSLLAAIASVVMGLSIGGVVGALAGGIGGKVDTVLMRVVDVMLAIPGILLAIAGSRRSCSRSP